MVTRAEENAFNRLPCIPIVAIYMSMTGAGRSYRGKMSFSRRRSYQDDHQDMETMPDSAGELWRRISLDKVSRLALLWPICMRIKLISGQNFGKQHSHFDIRVSTFADKH